MSFFNSIDRLSTFILYRKSEYFSSQSPKFHSTVCAKSLCKKPDLCKLFFVDAFWKFKFNDWNLPLLKNQNIKKCGLSLEFPCCHANFWLVREKSYYSAAVAFSSPWPLLIPNCSALTPQPASNFTSCYPPTNIFPTATWNIKPNFHLCLDKCPGLKIKKNSQTSCL